MKSEKEVRRGVFRPFSDSGLQNIFDVYPLILSKFCQRLNSVRCTSQTFWSARGDSKSDG